MNVLTETQSDFMSVFVARRYGGVHLGPRRFDIITSLAEEAIKAFNDAGLPHPPPTQFSPPSFEVETPLQGTMPAPPPPELPIAMTE